MQEELVGVRRVVAARLRAGVGFYWVAVKELN